MDIKKIPKHKLPTGIKRLDTILMGGLIEFDTHLIYGPPGTGKTVLCHQICFNLIRTRGIHCVYLNMLTESPSEIISHMAGFSFYDKNMIPEYLYYLMGEGQIKNHGISGLVPFIEETINHTNSRLFVFEGIENVLYQSCSDIDLIELVTQIRAIARTHFCTIILTIKQQEPNPVLTVVDSILELSDTIMGPRVNKELTIHKTRGSAFLPGRHAVELTGDGLQIHPRIESRPFHSGKIQKEQRKRISLGIPDLDSMMDGGIFSDSNLVVMGMPGSGKTTLGLSFLIEGAKHGQEGIFLGFFERPFQIIQKADKLDMALRPYIEQCKIKLLWQSPNGLILDSIIERLLEHLHSSENCGKRIFIDGIDWLSTVSIYKERMPHFFSSLLDHLHNCRATTVISQNIPLLKAPQLEKGSDYLDQLSESTIMLRYLRSGTRLQRFISVVKMRESWYCPETKIYQIKKGGIHIQEMDEEARNIMNSLRIQY